MTITDIPAHLVSGAIHYTSGALWTAVNAKALDSAYQTTSGAYIAHAADATIHYTSGAIWTDLNTRTLDTEYQKTSGAYIATETQYQTTSGAYIAHAADTTDPHGATLTQTNINSSGDVNMSGAVISKDFETISGAYVANMVYGIGSTPPTASGFTRGTIYVEYTL